MTRLRICDACSRHVFVTETSCPFCAAVLAPIRSVAGFKLSSRLSRAQRFALAGAVAGLIGCADDVKLEPPYGASFPGSGGVNGGGGAGGGISGGGGAGSEGTNPYLGAGCGGRVTGVGGDAGGFSNPIVPPDSDAGDSPDQDAGDDDAGGKD